MSNREGGRTNSPNVVQYTSMSKWKKRKVLSPRAIRRLRKNPHANKLVLTGLKKLIDTDSQNRPAYFAKFINGWRASASAADWLGERLLSHSSLDLGDDVRTSLLCPYECLSMIYFARLMDHMDESEESVFTDEIASVDAAWQKLLAVLHIRAPELTKEIDAIETSHRAIHDEVVGVFRGDYPPALRPQWGRAHAALTRALDDLVREGTK